MITTRITINTKKYDAFLKKAKVSVAEFKRAYKKLNALGISVKYEIDTTAFDYKISEIVHQSITSKILKRA